MDCLKGKSMVIRYVMSFVLLFTVCLTAAGQVSSAAIGEVAAYAEAGKHQQAVQAARKLIDAGKQVDGLAEFLIQSGSDLAKASRFGDTALYYQLVSDAFPDHAQIESIHTDLLGCYYHQRQLKRALDLTRKNLKRYPDSQWFEYWRFLDAQIQYRLYQFDAAKKAYEAFLTDYPDSQYARYAKGDLGRIDPDIEVDVHGIIRTRSRLAQDVRLQKAIADLPGLIEEGYGQLEDRLGVDLRKSTAILYSFIDKGPKVSGGSQATTRVIGIQNTPTTVVYFYCDAVVTDPHSYAVTAVHELKHAGFIGQMGAAYHDLPEWVREGLALWGTDDIDTRLHTVLSNTVAGGKDPMSALDGIEDIEHDYRDYMEDVLAFEWLESVKPGNVRTFCRRLIAGENYQAIWSDLAGMPYDKAMQQANAHCRSRVVKALGDAYDGFVPLRLASDRAAQAGNAAAAEWTASEERQQLESWINENKTHFASPYARFTLGRSLVMAGEHKAGRAWLRTLLEPDALRSSLMDNAHYWLGVSYNFERDFEKSKEAFGILLRDFPNSTSAPKIRGKFQPAAPVAE